MFKKNLSCLFIPSLWIFFVLLLLALMLKPGLSGLDPDLPWHLKFGRDTWLTRQLPKDQIHLWTLEGETWVDHEWLSEVLMYKIFAGFGYSGLNLFFALIALTAFILIARQLKIKHSRADYFIIILLLLGYLAVRPHLGPRPQLISWLFLVGEFLILQSSHAASSKDFTSARSKRLKTVLLLGGLFWLWACLHAGFLIGLAVLALWSAEQLIRGWHHQNPPQFWLGLQAGCLSFLVTLLTPYGFKLYDFLSTYTNSAYLSHINEWKPFYVFPLNYWQLLVVAITLALAVILYWPGGKKPAWQPWQWLSLLLFLGLGLKSARHWPLFFLTAGLTFFPIFLKVQADNQASFIWIKWLKKLLQIFLLITLLFALFFSIRSLPRIKDPFKDFCQDYPCQTVQQLQTHSRYSKLKLLNKYDYGGWLIWTWPDKKLFIDGRLPQYPLAGWSLLEEYLEFDHPSALAGKLKDYKIEAILWNNQMPQYQLGWLDKLMGFREADINNRPNNLKIFLDSSSDWQAVFKDSVSTVYIKKNKL